MLSQFRTKVRSTKRKVNTERERWGPPSPKRSRYQRGSALQGRPNYVEPDTSESGDDSYDSLEERSIPALQKVLKSKAIDLSPTPQRVVIVIEDDDEEEEIRAITGKTFEGPVSKIFKKLPVEVRSVFAFNLDVFPALSFCPAQIVYLTNRNVPIFYLDTLKALTRFNLDSFGG